MSHSSSTTLPAAELGRLRFGLMPLADSAPIVVAREMGFFARHGLDVTLSVEGSWAGLRDKLAAGMLDAAQLLAPMPLAAQLGLDGFGVPLVSALTTSRNGNMITVSPALFAAMAVTPGDAAATARALKQVLDTERAAGRPRRIFSDVFPFSSHHYLLCEWLASAGIEPERDLQIITIPPPMTVHSLRSGQIDGFCSGAPWSHAAETAGVGHSLLACRSIRTDCVEKVLAVRADWADRYPITHRKLVAALIEAGRWLDQPARRADAARQLNQGAYLDVPPSTVLQALSPDEGQVMNAGFKFSSADDGCPRADDAEWLLQQMLRWGQTRADLIDREGVASSYRADIHAEALQLL